MEWSLNANTILQFIYNNLYVITELGCFIISVIYLVTDKHIAWKLIIILMFVTCITEVSGIPYKELYKNHPDPHNSNAWIYNILLIFQIGIISNMYYHLLNEYVNNKHIIVCGAALLISLYIIELSFIHPYGIYIYNIYTYSVMSILIVVYSFYYYYLLLNADEYIELIKVPSFWWVSGSLFFFFGTTAINIYYNSLKVVPDIYKHYLSYISDTLIIILYGFWSYSFYLRKCHRIKLNT